MRNLTALWPATGVVGSVVSISGTLHYVTYSWHLQSWNYAYWFLCSIVWVAWTLVGFDRIRTWWR